MRRDVEIHCGKISDAGYLIEESLTRLEGEFGEAFLRIHRNCLVARARIREIGKLPGEDDGHFLRLDGLDERLMVAGANIPPCVKKLKPSKQ